MEAKNVHRARGDATAGPRATVFFHPDYDRRLRHWTGSADPLAPVLDGITWGARGLVYSACERWRPTAGGESHPALQTFACDCRRAGAWILASGRRQAAGRSVPPALCKSGPCPRRFWQKCPKGIAGRARSYRGFCRRCRINGQRIVRTCAGSPQASEIACAWASTGSRPVALRQRAVAERLPR